PRRLPRPPARGIRPRRELLQDLPPVQDVQRPEAQSRGVPRAEPRGRVESPKPDALLPKPWWRLQRGLGGRWREGRLPRGFERLGTRYGGWWLYAPAVTREPLLIDCGLGVDISFPKAFLERFGGRAIGIDPNPAALEYCRTKRPAAMDIRDAAFWKEAGATVTFHLPREPEQLPKGADGVSGSLLASHSYTGSETRSVRTTSLRELLASARRAEC